MTRSGRSMSWAWASTGSDKSNAEAACVRLRLRSPPRPPRCWWSGLASFRSRPGRADFQLPRRRAPLTGTGGSRFWIVRYASRDAVDRVLLVTHRQRLVNESSRETTPDCSTVASAAQWQSRPAAPRIHPPASILPNASERSVMMGDPVRHGRIWRRVRGDGCVDRSSGPYVTSTGSRTGQSGDA